jgi:hypothetical protein
MDPSINQVCEVVQIHHNFVILHVVGLLIAQDANCYPSSYRLIQGRYRVLKHKASDTDE